MKKINIIIIIIIGIICIIAIMKLFYPVDTEILKKEDRKLKGNSEDYSSSGNSIEIQYTDWGEIFIVNNAAMELFSYNEEATIGYPKAINNIASQVSSNVYSILVPTQIEFVDSKSVSYSQKSSIDAIYNDCSEDVTPIDVYSSLKEHSDEYIYMRTDHHWTAIGAYYAYTAMMDTLDKVAVPMNDFKRVDKEGFLGSLYNLTKSSKITKKPDTIMAFEPIVKTSYKKMVNGNWNNASVVEYYFFNKSDQYYGVYLGGDSSVSIIECDTNSDEKILIIKDSYANALIPFLTSHYKEIHIIDPRMFEENIIEYINTNNFDDVLFLNYALVNRYTGYVDYFNRMGGILQSS